MFYSDIYSIFHMKSKHISIPCSYEVMRKCWEEKSEKRPKFSYILQKMGNMLTDSYKKVSVTLFFCFLRFHNNTQNIHAHITHQMSDVD